RPRHSGRLRGDLEVVGVSLACPVYGAAAGRHVAGRGQPYDGVPQGHRVEVKALVPDQLGGAFVQLDPGQHLLVAEPAARIAVDDIDQLPDGVLAVGRDLRRDALAYRPPVHARDAT